MVVILRLEVNGRRRQRMDYSNTYQQTAAKQTNQIRSPIVVDVLDESGTSKQMPLAEGECVVVPFPLMGMDSLLCWNLGA